VEECKGPGRTSQQRREKIPGKSLSPEHGSLARGKIGKKKPPVQVQTSVEKKAGAPLRRERARVPRCIGRTATSRKGPGGGQQRGKRRGNKKKAGSSGKVTMKPVKEPAQEKQSHLLVGKQARKQGAFG